MVGSQPGSGLSLSTLPFLWHIVKYLVNIFEALTKRNYINTRAYAKGAMSQARGWGKEAQVAKVQIN